MEETMKLTFGKNYCSVKCNQKEITLRPRDLGTDNPLELICLVLDILKQTNDRYIQDVGYTGQREEMKNPKQYDVIIEMVNLYNHGVNLKRDLNAALNQLEEKSRGSE